LAVVGTTFLLLAQQYAWINSLQNFCNRTLAQFMVLMSVMNLSLVAFEVPTGIVADQFSRKGSVCSGTFFMGITVLATLSTVQYPLLVVAFALWGLGESLVSGADSALLYDSLKAERKEEAFQKTIGNAISLQLAAVVSGTVLCGIIVDRVGLEGPLWTCFASFLLATVVISRVQEPPFLVEARAQDPAPSFQAQWSSYGKHLGESLRFVVHSRALIALVFVNIVVLRLGNLTERPFAQPYLSSFGYDPELISYFFTIFYLITALSAKYSHTVARLLGNRERNSMLLIGLLGVVSLSFMVNATIGPVVVAAMVGIYLMRGLFEPLMQNSLNRRFTSEKRASCLSIAKMGNNFLGVFLGPLFGYLADVFSLPFSLSIFQWVFISLLLLCIVSGWRVLEQTVQLEATPESPPD